MAYDFGLKTYILRMLCERGCLLTLVLVETPVKEIRVLKPDGVFLSNSMGDPEACDYVIATVRELLSYRFPIFGMCLWHQLLALALGTQTRKIPFGHHGINHPVQDLDSGRVLITSRNHGFEVDASTLPVNVRITHQFYSMDHYRVCV